MMLPKRMKLICLLFVLLLLMNIRAVNARYQSAAPQAKPPMAQVPSAMRITYAELGTNNTPDYQIINPGRLFAPDTPQFVCVWRVEGIPQGGTTLRAVWIAEDTGGVAPPNYQIAEKVLPLPECEPMLGNTSLSQPTKG